MLKTCLHKIQTLSFYMSDDIDKPRPILGIIMDFLLILLGLFSLLYLWLVYRTKSPLLSLIISLWLQASLDLAFF